MKELSFVLIVTYVALLANFLGSLLFLSLSILIPARWLDSLVPSFKRFLNLRWYLPVLFLGNVALASHFYPWAARGWSGAFLHNYNTLPGFLFRGFLLWIVWWILSIGIEKRSTWAGGLGLVILLFTGSIASVDTIMSVGDKWTSTIFGLVFLVGAGVIALASAQIMVEKSRQVSGDIGNVYLTLLGTWMYLVFVQYLIYWSGNLPKDAAWYNAHFHGVWETVVIAAIILQFALPLPLLLFRSFKASARNVSRILLVGAFAQILYFSWQLGGMVRIPVYFAVVPLLIFFGWISRFSNAR